MLIIGIKRRGETYFKVMDERLHALLHGGTGRRNEFVIINFDNASGHLVQTLQCVVSYVAQEQERRMTAEKTHLVDDA